MFAPDNPLTGWDRKYSSMLHAEVIGRALQMEADNGNVEESTKSRRRKSRRMRKNRDLAKMFLQLVPNNFVGGGSKTRIPVFHFHAVTHSVRGERIVGLYLE